MTRCTLDVRSVPCPIPNPIRYGLKVRLHTWYTYLGKYAAREPYLEAVTWVTALDSNKFFLVNKSPLHNIYILQKSLEPFNSVTRRPYYNLIIGH